MAEDDREPIMGLRRRPPAGDFPAAVGWAMLLMLVNGAAEVFLGLLSSAGSIPLAALTYAMGAGFLVFAVGLARLRRWAWLGSLGWAALAIGGGVLGVATTQDARYLPLLPAIAIGVLLVPGVGRALRPPA